jgi:hypothetical protein
MAQGKSARATEADLARLRRANRANEAKIATLEAEVAACNHTAPRAVMTDEEKITARMARDLNALRAEHEAVERQHLFALGWTPEQVRTYFDTAVEHAAFEWGAENDAAQAA